MASPKKLAPMPRVAGVANMTPGKGRPLAPTGPSAVRQTTRPVRRQTAGPRSGGQKGLRSGRASAISWNTARRKAASRAPQPPSGFDIGKAIGDLLNPSRQASEIVPNTLRNLPQGGVRGVLKPRR